VKKKTVWMIVSMIMVLAMFLAACGGNNNQNASNSGSNSGSGGSEQSSGGQAGSGSGEPPAKVAIVFATGGLGDRSFNDTAYAGIERAKNELGIVYDYVEPQAISEFETFHRDFASTGEYDLIVGISFDQLDAITTVSAEFPDQKFLLIDQAFEGDVDNVASAIFKSNESSFLAGALAALKSETKKLGFLGGMDIPLINEFLSGYIAGAKYVDPSVEVIYKYTNEWANPNLGKEMALSMYESGADVVYAAAGGSGNGVFMAAKEKGKWSIGGDMTPAQEPDNMIVGTLKRLDNTIYNNIQDVINGTWKPGLQALGLADEGVDYSIDGGQIEIPQDIIDIVEDLKAKVISGEITVPATLDEVDAFLASK